VKTRKENNNGENPASHQWGERQKNPAENRHIRQGRAASQTGENKRQGIERRTGRRGQNHKEKTRKEHVPKGKGGGGSRKKGGGLGEETRGNPKRGRITHGRK